jgi:pyridoxal phosphate enzyme (YggS family)
MIAENLDLVLKSISSNVALVAVSKTKPKEDIVSAYQAGQRHFGENKVQELAEKWEALPKDICWHAIGHLQTNKVKYIAEFVHLIHAVDSLKLLNEINKQALKHNRVIDCLLQFHIAKESTKFGLDETESSALLESEAYSSLQNIRIVGVMGMATFTSDQNQIVTEFNNLESTFSRLKGSYFSNEPSFKEISMGMSGDYQLAIDCGSTIVRVGSKIFGTR